MEYIVWYFSYGRISTSYVKFVCFVSFRTKLPVVYDKFARVCIVKGMDIDILFWQSEGLQTLNRTCFFNVDVRTLQSKFVFCFLSEPNKTISLYLSILSIQVRNIRIFRYKFYYKSMFSYIYQINYQGRFDSPFCSLRLSWIMVMTTWTSLFYWLYSMW